MRAMVLNHAGQRLWPMELAVPKPVRGQLLVKVTACAVCRTDLHVVDGELPNPKLPLIPGHEIVGRVAAQQFAKSLGAVWAGDSNALPSEPLDSAIIFAPDGSLVPLALKAVGKGGTVVCGGIHMSDIPSFPCKILWQERTVCSVANLTRRDAEKFLTLAPRVPVHTQIEMFRLGDANEALRQLREGKLQGAAVLVMD